MSEEKVMVASFDVNTEEGMMKVINAQSGASKSFKTLNDGDVLEIEAVLQYQERVDAYGTKVNKETGEIEDSLITTLYATDGTTYAGVSDTISKSAENLIKFMKQFEKEKVYVKIVKAKSGKGNEFLNLQLTTAPIE